MDDRSRVGGYSIDHALFAGRDLERLETAFRDLGFEPAYGGEHAHDVTHNSLLGFDDGSYLELISTTSPDVDASRRNAFIKNDAGPAGWALEVDDAVAASDRVADLGVRVRRPGTHERTTPSGDRAVWQLAYLGEGEPGTELPFLIEDKSPRENRIVSGPDASETGVTGVGIVVVAVDDIDAAIETYRAAFDLPDPERRDAESFDARVAYFPRTGTMLATPLGETSWVADRLEAFGALPCAVLLSVEGADAAFDRFDVTETERWFDRRIGWLSLDRLGGRLGLVGPQDDRRK